ncbi:hypothetical protein MU448_11445 [Streptococcus sp. O1]|uniref:hypothetical protein n=1 Tax=Streptococcus sp. O1 TaxID=2928735 RepID=UPI00211ABCBB|nr:hypothetical protein [Streptococcus sp. O1]MCQ9214958.1 hypothetical protein [Streptococcus sp. O1]
MKQIKHLQNFKVSLKRSNQKEKTRKRNHLDIKAELEELENKTPKPTEKGERKMGKDIEVRSKLNAFIRSEGTEKEGLKTVDGVR